MAYQDRDSRNTGIMYGIVMVRRGWCWDTRGIVMEGLVIIGERRGKHGDYVGYGYDTKRIMMKYSRNKEARIGISR